MNARMDKKHNQNTSRNGDSTISHDLKYQHRVRSDLIHIGMRGDKITKSKSDLVEAGVFNLRQSTLR